MAALDEFLNAIGTIESGNNYNAVGVDTGRMGRALGRYQIMSANWGAWSREAGLGMSADWKDPKNQDAVARHIMNKYYQRYRNWDLVATAWFGGPGAANKAEKAGVGKLGNTKDALGTSVPEYVRRYRQVWNPDGGSTTATGQARADQQPKGPAAQPRAKQSLFAQPFQMMKDAATPGRAMGTRGYNIAPLQAVEGSVLTEVQQQTRDDQINQESLGAIMDTISEASKSTGGQILDAKSLFGIPTREEPTPVAAQSAPDPASAESSAAPAPDSSGLALADPPSHHGFKGLQPNAQTMSRALLAAIPGIRFSSGLRSEAANKAANGDKNSKHLTGHASDFSGTEEQLQKAAAWAKSQGGKTLIHDAGSGRHLHVTWP